MVEMDEIITKYFKSERLSHAYLLETNDYNKVLQIAENIILDSKHNENIEYLMEKETYADYKVIEPDGQWIKKEQISDLKSEFNSKSVYNNKRVYVIKNAENLNKAAANTMLKFLEEPEDDIVALLITNNKNKVLDTLVSRCQYINLDTHIKEKIQNEADCEQILSILELKRQNAASDIYKIFDSYGDKNKLKNILNDLIIIYEQSLLKAFGLSINNNENFKIFDKIINNNKISDMQKKISGLMLAIDLLEYNVNIRLLTDKLVISMFGVD